MTYVDEDQPGEESEELAELDAGGLIQRALDVVNTAKTMPLSASVLISRDEVVGMLTPAVERLPDELRQARWLLREREEFLAERAREAEALMEEVRAQAERMVPRTEIVRQARTRWPRRSSTTPTRRPVGCATRPRTTATRSWPAWRSCSTGSCGRSSPGARSSSRRRSRPRPRRPHRSSGEAGEDGFFDQDMP